MQVASAVPLPAAQPSPGPQLAVQEAQALLSLTPLKVLPVQGVQVALVLLLPAAQPSPGPQLAVQATQLLLSANAL